MSNTSGSGTGGNYTVIGMLTNTGSQTKQFAEAVVTAYDLSGRVAGCGSIFMSSTNLVPGQTNSFGVDVNVQDASQVRSFKMQVDEQ